MVWEEYEEHTGNESLIKNRVRYDGSQFTHIHDVRCAWAGNDYVVLNEYMPPNEVLEYLKDNLDCFVPSFLLEYPDMVDKNDHVIKAIMDYFNGIEMHQVTEIIVKDMLTFMEDDGIYIEDSE